MKLIIIQENSLVGEIENYEGPVPRPGEYIYHPPIDPD
jgi:hypothetical protein